MVDTSENQAKILKGILITAPSCSGKSHLLKIIENHKDFAKICIFEMDWLEYYVPKELTTRLIKAEAEFQAWFSTQQKSNLLESIYSNILASKDDARLIKYKLVELCLIPESFITVLPQALRNGTANKQFLTLLEKYFHSNFLHVAIAPRFSRHMLNFALRLEVLNLPYIKRMLAGSNSLRLKRDSFDYMFEPSVFRNPRYLIIDVFRKQLGL